MDAAADFPLDQSFAIEAPDKQTIPFVFDSPHSGRIYPQAFIDASRLDPMSIRRSEDAFVDELFASVTERGAPLLHALFPRAFLDLNREPYELDPKLFSSRLPQFANSSSARVAGGLGTIARVVAESQEIYAGQISLDDALSRIRRHYRPYHDALRRLLARTHVAFGCAVLIDCHSMPTTIRTISGRTRADIVLGNRFGSACAPIIMETADRALSALGYKVARNKPYAGGFITEHYGRPERGLHALQIEINRGLYLDEIRFIKRSSFDALARDLGFMVDALAEIPPESLLPTRAAAE
ncbi:MAG: N-formylglutamate amidohydrolase [Hyphomicrobiales bacterium]|nr:N-formylglutamate amidohydrolase [Hyphomicrobiales bacterium]